MDAKHDSIALAGDEQAKLHLARHRLRSLFHLAVHYGQGAGLHCHAVRPRLGRMLDAVTTGFSGTWRLGLLPSG
jgi:hypothetical protein